MKQKVLDKLDDMALGLPRFANRGLIEARPAC